MAQNIQKPDVIAGYVHPEDAHCASNTKVYKTFTTGKKVKKNEKFGNTYHNKGYCTMIQTEETIICPICNDPVVHTCPCSYNDKKCQNGHVWYTNREGKTIKGNPHKS